MRNYVDLSPKDPYNPKIRTWEQNNLKKVGQEQI